MLTQGQFSFLPPLTDTQILAQIGYALGKAWAVSVEHTDDPHPRNTYWEMYGMPLFDLKDPARIFTEVQGCRATFPEHYVRVIAFDATRGWEAPRMSFIVNRPPQEARFALVRQEAQGRSIRYTTHARDRS